MRNTAPRRDARKIIAMLAAIVVPVGIVLWNVRAPAPWSTQNSNPTPYGYTISLLLFAIPLLLIAAWHVAHPEHPHHRQALAWSSGAIAIAGAALDIGFGSDFFVFRNTSATLQIRLPAWNFTERHFIGSYLPIEEFLFYALGGLFLVALYSWADGDWLPDMDRDEYTLLAKAKRRLIEPSPRSVALWLAFVGIGFLIKWASGDGTGVPGYFLFLMGFGFLPTFLWLRAVGPFVNWRAFGFAYSALLLISLIWEVTLALPYEWWNYQPQHMLGVRLVAWSGLPLEAVLVWLIIAWVAVLLYEFCRVFLHMDRPMRHALLGRPSSGAPLNDSQ